MSRDVSGWIRLAINTGYFCLRHRPWRRQLMFYLTLATMGQAVVGVIFFDALFENSWAFVIFWTFCSLLVVLMVMLALYDILAIRAEQRNELRRLHKDIFEDQDGS